MASTQNTETTDYPQVNSGSPAAYTKCEPQNLGDKQAEVVWTVRVGSDNRTRKISPGAKKLIMDILAENGVEILSSFLGQGTWQGPAEEVLTLELRSQSGVYPVFSALRELLVRLEQDADASRTSINCFSLTTR